MTYKRYQFIGCGGKIEWTPWFKWNSTNRDPWQLKGKLRNEFKEED